MSYENSGTDSEPLRQNKEFDRALPALSDRDIEELVHFFQLLDEWDRQFASKPVP